MKRILSFLLVAVCATASAASSVRDIGDISVAVDNRVLSVHVSANTPELSALARKAFGAHGRYNVVPGGGQYDIAFTQVGPNQVRVEITRNPGATPVHAQVVAGTSAHNALLRAADLAVEKTNGLGLRGFFASKLAFIADRGRTQEVCVGDLFFGEVREVTQDRAHALSPRWSPDGNRIVYTGFFQSGFPDIYQIDLGTLQRTTFVSFKGTNTGARFSPNGQQVAMILTGEGHTEVYVGNAQGRLVSRKTRSDTVKSSPCWSPDGTRIVFASEPGPQLYVVPATGGPMSRLPISISSYCAEPDWSRAAPTKIAFTIRTGGRYQIAVFDMATGKAEQVSKAPFDGVEPSWLADGRHLVYTARTASDSRICILDTETGKSTVVSNSISVPALQASVWGP